jgi:hypothetical protein
MLERLYDLSCIFLNIVQMSIVQIGLVYKHKYKQEVNWKLIVHFKRLFFLKKTFAKKKSVHFSGLSFF